VSHRIGIVDPADEKSAKVVNKGTAMLGRISAISFWTDGVGQERPSFGGYFQDIASVVSGRRARQRTLERYNDLIENADQHMLNDLGVSRSDLFRLREALFDR
jgi:uncharacterized protein YjiS (DUF1127 family)